MSRLLLDTSAYSAWVRGYEPLMAPFQGASDLCLGLRRQENEKRLRQFLASPRVRVLGIDEETVPPYAAVAGTSTPWLLVVDSGHGAEVLAHHHPGSLQAGRTYPGAHCR